MELQGALNSQTNLGKEQRQLPLPNFNASYITTVMKTVWNWHKDRHTVNRIESLEINICGQFI